MPNKDSTLRIAFIGLAGLAVGVGIGRFAFTPLLPMMQADGLITISDGGFLATVHFIGYLIGALTAAWIPVSPRVLLPASLVAIGLATLAMGFSEQFEIWLMLRSLAGVVSAWVLVLVGTYCIKALAEAGQPNYKGWVFSGVGAGIALAGLACFSMMVSGVSSAASWQIIGILALLISGLIWKNSRAALPAVHTSQSESAEGRTPIVWSIVVAYGAAGLGYIIPGTYLPAMAREIVPSPWIFGWGWPIFGTAAFLSTLASAWLHRRFSNRQIWCVGQFVMATGLILPVLYAHILSIIAAGLCVGGTFMVITMAGLNEAHRVATPTDTARHVGVMTAAFAVGQLIGPFFASALHLATSSFTPSLIATSIILIITAVPLMRPTTGTSSTIRGT